MAGSEADGGTAGVNVGPVVVGVRYAKVSGILGAVGVRVPDERGFPVVVDVAVGDRYVVCCVGELCEKRLAKVREWR